MQNDDLVAKYDLAVMQIKWLRRNVENLILLLEPHAFPVDPSCKCYKCLAEHALAVTSCHDDRFVKRELKIEYK